MPARAMPSIARRRKRPQRQNTRSVGVPAPMQGILANTPIYGVADNSFTQAIWLYNMIPSELGVRVRDGSREFATNVLNENGVPGEVRTLMYLNSVAAGVANDKYFAATADGIYDVTAGGAGPHTRVLEWPIKDAENAGWCAYRNYTNVGGDHYLLVTDEANGYYIYDAGLDSWAPGTFTGSPKPEAQDLVDITEWQGRIWFVERNTARGWFLDPLALTGDIAAFDVGNRFKKGGHLVQQTTWTVDDGEGMDDRFVQVSSSGDLLVWQGVSPTTAADMSLLGRWSVGQVPEGRRVLSAWGGDVMILSRFGLLKLSALLTGLATLNDDSFVSKNIARYFRTQMKETVDLYGWAMEVNPSEGIAIFSAPNAPEDANMPPIQFALNTNTQAWCMFRGLDMRCMDYNVNGFFFGTRDGRVMIQTGSVDNAALVTPNVTGDWTYIAPSDVTEPIAGEWNTNVAETLLRIHKIDGDAVDRSVDLAKIVSGSRIKMTQDGNQFRLYDYQVSADPVVSGDVFNFTVTRIGVGLQQFSGTWNYSGIDDTVPGLPLDGNWNRNTAETLLRIADIDNTIASNDQTLILSRIFKQSTVRFVDDADSDAWVEFLTTADPTDEITAFTYVCVQNDIGPNGYPTVTNGTQMTADVGGPPLVGESCIMTGEVAQEAGKTIEWSMLTHYSNVGEAGKWKRGQFIRPSFIGEAFPTYGIQMRYDYNLSEVGTWPPFIGVPLAQWDNAIWDIDVWAGGAQEYNQLAGLDGMGRSMAIALRGESSFDLSLIGFDVMFDSGGLL